MVKELVHESSGRGFNSPYKSDCHHMDFSLEANVPVVLVVVQGPNLGWTSKIHKAGVCQRLVRAALDLFE
jgi:hypothetical protein